MRSVGSFEAKTHLTALLEQVSRGESIEITRRGVPVAILTPVRSNEKTAPHETARRIRVLRKGVKLAGLSLRKLIDEGRA